MARGPVAVARRRAYLASMEWKRSTNFLNNLALWSGRFT